MFKANQSYLYYLRYAPFRSRFDEKRRSQGRDRLYMHGSFLTAETEVSKSHDPKDDHLLLTFEATN